MKNKKEKGKKGQVTLVLPIHVSNNVQLTLEQCGG